MESRNDGIMGKEEERIKEETPYHENTKVRKNERRGGRGAFVMDFEQIFL